VRALVDRLGCLETIPARCPDIVHKFVGYRLGPRLGVVQSSSERTPPHIHRWHVETDIRRQIVTLDAFAFANSPIIPSAIAEYYGVRFTLFGHFSGFAMQRIFISPHCALHAGASCP